MSEPSVNEVQEHTAFTDTLNQTCFLSDDVLMRHIDHLQKEKETWRALYDEKRQLASKDASEENSSSEDDAVQLVGDDLTFLSETPDYQKVGKMYAQMHKTIIIVCAQHDKTKRCFNSVLQRIISHSHQSNFHRITH